MSTALNPPFGPAPFPGERHRDRRRARAWARPATDAIPDVQADGRTRARAKGRGTDREAVRARRERDARWAAHVDRIRDNAASHHPGGLR